MTDFAGKQFDLSRSEKRCLQLRDARARELERRAQDLEELAKAERSLAFAEAKADVCERIGAPAELDVEFLPDKDGAPGSIRFPDEKKQLSEETFQHEKAHELESEE